MFQHQHNTLSAVFVNTEHLSVLGFSKYNEASSTRQTPLELHVQQLG